jgi:hypothetical protein
MEYATGVFIISVVILIAVVGTVPVVPVPEVWNIYGSFQYVRVQVNGML